MITEEEILEEVKNAKAKNWKILPNITYNKELMICCPLGAKLVSQNEAYSCRNFNIASERWGISRNEAASFVSGFDGKKNCPGDDQYMYDLGKKIRGLLYCS